MKTVLTPVPDQTLFDLPADAENDHAASESGRRAAESRRRAEDPRDDPKWRAAYDHMIALMRTWPDRGYRFGKITEEDKYEDPLTPRGQLPA